MRMYTVTHEDFLHENIVVCQDCLLRLKLNTVECFRIRETRTLKYCEVCNYEKPYRWRIP